MLNLTHMDVKKLTQEPSGKVRGMLAAKIAMDYRSGNFSDSESDIASDIFRILLKDAEKQVRKTLSDHLSHCPHAPHDIIMRLARDDQEVAVPVLEHSSVLTDHDLMALVESTKEVLKLTAIARREQVSKPVSDILLDTQNEQVLGTLFQNKGAVLSEHSLNMAWDSVSSNRTLLETLVHRGNLPLTIAEKIYYVVADDLKRQLSKQYKLSTPIIQKAANDAREWQMLGVIPSDGIINPNDDDRVEDLIDQLYLSGRLTHSFLMRALCVGSLGVFEAGIARLASVPRVNARILLMDSGALGFHAIYKTASMPDSFTEAVGTLLRISLEETDFGRNKQIDFRKRVIDRIYKEGYNRSVENMEYLLAIIGGKIAASGVH